MKIALVGRYGEGDILTGPERIARELYLQLKKQNIDVTPIEYFFSSYSDFSLLNRIFGNKITRDGILRLGIIPLIYKLLKKKFNIIHFINSQRFSLVIFFLKPFLKVKFISSLHGSYKDETKILSPKRSFLDLWVEKISVRKSEILIFPSKLLLGQFKKNYEILESRSKVIYNGVSKIFIKKKIRFDNKKNYNFVYYNSFNEGLKELLGEVSTLKNSKFRLFVIGKRVNIENVSKNIEINFADPMDYNSLPEFLSDKHFIIKSSAFDSFSIFTGECMSNGIIPIVTENTGINELIKRNVNGFIYNSSERGSLVILLKDIYSGKFNLNEISSNSARIYEELNWEKVSEHYKSIYKSIV